MKGTLAKRGRQCSSLEKEINKAVADKDTMEKWLREAEARLKQAVDEKAAAESAEEAFRAEADSQARRILGLESELAILRADLEAEVVAKEGLQAELAEVKVESAKEKMELKEIISKSAKQSALLQSLSYRLVAVEQEVESTKVDAVEAFKDSQAFADAVAECSTDSYQLGFADCKEATAKLFPDLDLSKVNPLSCDEEEEEEAVVEDVADQRVDEVDDGSSSVIALAEAKEENASREP